MSHTLKSIEARIKAATGQDDEELLIIRQLVDALDLSTTEAGNIRLFASAGAYLSAAVALVEKCLPNATWSCGIQPKPYKAEATIYGPIKPWPESTRYEYGHHAKAPTPALALLCAFVAAMGEK